MAWSMMRRPPADSRRGPSEHESGPEGPPKRRRRTKIGPGHVTYAMAAHHEGHSIREIAGALGVGVATVDRMLRHPRNVDADLLQRLLLELRLQRIVRLEGMASNLGHWARTKDLRAVQRGLE